MQSYYNVMKTSAFLVPFLLLLLHKSSTVPIEHKLKANFLRIVAAHGVHMDNPF